MEQQRLRYGTGDEIHVGDRVDSCGTLGTVMFVVEHDEWTPEFPKEAWSYLGAGFMVREDSGTLIHYDNAESPCIRLVARGDTELR